MRRDVEMRGLNFLLRTKPADFARCEQDGREDALLRIGSLWE
jgi:hypothetical protein